MPAPTIQGHALLLDLYELAMAESYFKYRRSAQATFELFVRNIPSCRSYLVFAGLEDALIYIESLRFSKEDIAYLEGLGYFSGEFLSYLERFRFQGDVYAMSEGEVFFAGEPVLRVTAPIIEAQIVESYLLNTINLSTMIASKAARIVQAAGERGVFDFALRRTHGTDAALKVARSSYIAGFKGTSNVLAAKRYGMRPVGTMAHSFVMTFESELESFRAFSSTFPERSILLVDTYHSLKGVANAITVAGELKKKGFTLLGIRLDSGDLARLSRAARRMLDASGLQTVKIFASGNLDEYAIAELVKAHAPIDDFGVGTNMGTSCDAPFLDVIYKITEVTNAKGHFLPTMKLSHRKVTYPGRKQIWRLHKDGVFEKDIIALESEQIKNGRPLLKQVIKQGSMLQKHPPLNEIRSQARYNISQLPQQCRKLKSRYRYPVHISAGVRQAVSQFSAALIQRSKKSVQTKG